MILSKSIHYIGYQNKSKYKLGLNDIQSLRNICISELYFGVYAFNIKESLTIFVQNSSRRWTFGWNKVSFS